MTYGAFLTALFLIAAGCSILETSANPYVLSIGPEETATRRLNFAQAFNPVGTNIGVLLATALILPKLDAPVDVAASDARAGAHDPSRPAGCGDGTLPRSRHAAAAHPRRHRHAEGPEIVEEFPDTGEKPQGGIAAILWKNKRYRFGVVAQFFNVAAQVCTWTYIIQYVQQAMNGSLALGGMVLQISLILFLISRFVMTWIIGRVRPTKVLSVMGALAVLCCLYAMVAPNITGVVALVLVSVCLSLMFPTIYGVALKGLGPATKFGAAGLVMAIVGGAIMPLVQGRILDATSPAISFIVPAIGFAVVALFAVYDLRAKDTAKTAAPREVTA